MNWILFFFGVSWVAVFTSQSLVDLADTMFVIGALTLAFKQKQLKDYFQGFKPAWLWIVWLAVLIVGLILNADLKSSETWVDFLEFRWVLSFLAVIYLTVQIKDTQKIIRLWLWLTVVLNVVALLMYTQDPHWRAGGILKQVMSFSHNIAPAWSLFAIYLLQIWKETDQKTKILIGMVAFTSGLLTLLTFTRGVWIGSFVGILVALFLWNRKVFARSVVAALVLGAVLVGTNQRIRDRVLGGTMNETQSNDERIALWKGNWRIIQDYPIFGVGIGQNKLYLRKYYDEFGYPAEQRISHAHNQYLQMWAGTGTIGFILFLAFNFIILRESYRGYKASTSIERMLQLGLIAALICFQIGALTESNFNIAKNRHFFLVLAGIAIGQSINSRKQNT